MTGFLHKVRSWWNRDAEELAEEEMQMTEHERNRAQEDYEGQKDDVRVDRGFIGRGSDFERDSEGPRY